MSFWGPIKFQAPKQETITMIVDGIFHYLDTRGPVIRGDAREVSAKTYHLITEAVATSD